MESYDSEKSSNTLWNVEPKFEWVSFEPFDDFGARNGIKFSFAPYITEKIEDNSFWNESPKLGELNARMESVECSLLKLGRLFQI